MEDAPQRVDEARARPQHRPGEPAEERERREVAEQDVLDHVAAERALGVVVERRHERDEQQHDPEREEADPPAAAARPAPPQRPHAPARRAPRAASTGTSWSGSSVQCVTPTESSSRPPAIESARQVRVFHYHLVTSRVREVEARYLAKLGFELVARYGRIGEEHTSYEPGVSWDELDKLGFKLRLAELERGAVNVVVQPGQWELPRVDHIGIALDEDEFAATLARADQPSCACRSTAAAARSSRRRGLPRRAPPAARVARRAARRGRRALASASCS